ncbi:MAG TPA: hypothetical protein VHN39_16825 [Phenylobacterium sp.]|jgi:hypothetical protein|nr:hypothetical protein [Phenylobacterium sp.]
MSVSKDRNAAPANETPDAAELADGQLDAVSGGGAAVKNPTVDLTVNQQKGSEKAAAAADALIRG